MGDYSAPFTAAAVASPASADLLGQEPAWGLPTPVRGSQGPPPLEGPHPTSPGPALALIRQRLNEPGTAVPGRGRRRASLARCDSSLQGLLYGEQDLDEQLMLEIYEELTSGWTGRAAGAGGAPGAGAGLPVLAAGGGGAADAAPPSSSAAEQEACTGSSSAMSFGEGRCCACCALNSPGLAWRGLAWRGLTSPGLAWPGRGGGTAWGERSAAKRCCAAADGASWDGNIAEVAAITDRQAAVMAAVQDSRRQGSQLGAVEAVEAGGGAHEGWAAPTATQPA
jgi:hypothetical protein